MTYTGWMTAILCNGLGRYADAEAAAQHATQGIPEIYVSWWALPELAEAAARTGDRQLADSTADQLVEATQPGGTDWGLGIAARCRALVSEGQAADGLYREAIDRLGRTKLRTELARAHLLYGEWLRRENRRTDAREQLRTAVPESAFHENFMATSAAAAVRQASRDREVDRFSRRTYRERHRQPESYRRPRCKGVSCSSHRY
jgi:hypothetical protein